jgi:hypothetical protein
MNAVLNLGSENFGGPDSVRRVREARKPLSRTDIILNSCAAPQFS